MYRVINDYVSKVNILSNGEIYYRIDSFVSKVNYIAKYAITCNFNRYIVDIILDDFSFDKAVKFFNDFNCQVAYGYSSFFVRFNEGNCIRYRFVTSKENKEAFYCDIVIR